jgi:2-aminoadipate transaminase
MDVHGLPKDVLSAKARRATDPPIAWLLRAAIDQPEIISLAAGLVDQESLPVSEIAECAKELLGDDQGKAPLQYGTTAGFLPLRHEICRMLEAQGADKSISPEGILLTAGSHQLLHLITDTLINEGDIVLVEDPTYFAYMGTLRAAGANVMGVGLDENGIIPEALERKLRFLKDSAGLERLKLVYLMTYFQNPTGTSLTWERKKRVYETLSTYCDLGERTFIVEDAAYKELRFEGEDIPYLKSLDRENRSIVLTGSFSKSFSPGLRVGFGWLPQQLLDHVVRQKGNEDFGSSNLCQHLLHRAMASRRYSRHLEMLRARYRRKRDLMLRCIEDHLPSEVKVIRPHGGMFVWASAPAGLDTGSKGEFFAEALRKKVLYVPGEYCYCPEEGIEKPVNKLRLSFGMVTEENIIEGMTRLGEAFREVLK